MATYVLLCENADGDLFNADLKQKVVVEGVSSMAALTAGVREQLPAAPVVDYDGGRRRG